MLQSTLPTNRTCFRRRAAGYDQDHSNKDVDESYFEKKRRTLEAFGGSRVNKAIVASTRRKVTEVGLSKPLLLLDRIDSPNTFQETLNTMSGTAFTSSSKHDEETEEQRAMKQEAGVDGTPNISILRKVGLVGFLFLSLMFY